jgi:hypothetical protein
VAVQIAWPFRWSAPTLLVGGPSWSPNKVGHGTGRAYYLEVRTESFKILFQVNRF